MPTRKTPLVSQQIYHVYNRGIDGRDTFLDKKCYWRILQLINYYRFSSQAVRFSRYLDLPETQRKKTIDKLYKQHELINIFAYCIMPNHFHLLLEQMVDNGISKFLSNLLNSYTRYFNTRNKRIGQLFLGQFKASLIESEAQMLHVSRYIHLNPYSSGLTRDFDDLLKYEWSSLPEYLYSDGQDILICHRDKVMSHFSSIAKYKEFIFDQKDYQRKLKSLQYLLHEP